jgi:hypothetical protein
MGWQSKRPHGAKETKSQQRRAVLLTRDVEQMLLSILQGRSSMGLNAGLHRLLS